MFKKSFRVKTHTALKGSDRKKIRADILKNFKCLDEESLNELLPNKGDVTVMKICTNSGENALVYFFQKNPMFFELNRTIFPTVYLLWKHPQIMLSFTTWPPVFEKLAAGASLMLPGLVIKGEVHPWTFKHVEKGASCIINLRGNLAPVAVGQMLMSGRDMYDSNMKGKGINIVHYFGDELWAAGDKSKPPHIPQEVDSSDSEEDTNCTSKESSQSETEEMNNLTITDTTEESATCDVEQKGEEEEREEEDCHKEDEDSEDEQLNAQKEMDELLLHCFLYALKTRLKEKDLPITTVNFYRNHMKAFCLPGQTLEIKKSSYKKFSKFLQMMQAKEFIRVTEKSKGVDVIDWFDKTHPDLKDLVVPDLEESEGQNSSGNKQKLFSIVEMRIVKDLVLPVFKDFGYVKGSAIRVNEIRNVVIEYVKKNQLQKEGDTNKAQVQLDPVLAGIVLRPGENNKFFMEWKDLISRVTGKMEVAHQMKLGDQPPVLKKGQLKNVCLEVQKRMNNKKATIVYNLESFGIVPEDFAHEVSVGVACSTSVSQADNKMLGKQVMIQGNQINFVGKLLLDKYGLPKRFVKGLELAPKKGRRT